LKSKDQKLKTQIQRPGIQMSKQSEEVRALLQGERNGLLSTISMKLAGWPFGSIAPYATTSAGEPIILISEIAEHTRNLRADSRASLLVQDSRALHDPQAGARVTLVGYAMPVPRPFLEDASRRYLSSFPNSESFFDAHDFILFQIKISKVRYIGGFGEIYWLEGREIIDASAESSIDPLAANAEMICEHMNEDHADALRLYAAAFADTQAESARMIHVDSRGFDIVALVDNASKHLRIDFPSPVGGTEEVRAVMVEMVRRAREMVAGQSQSEKN
jgi:heme oxygenase (biliverdin-IX-beta and delta-forming)